MIAIDTNLLVYAHRTDVPFHLRARDFIRNASKNEGQIGIPYHCLIEFLTVVTHPKIFKLPTPLSIAFGQVNNLMDDQSVRILHDSEDMSTLIELTKIANAKGPEIHDARIAAVCLDNGITSLYTADRNLSRYPRLTTVNPLV